ncbi:MAG: hypothetical protein KAW90_04985, partial [Dehalococcoidales bacterium]|nr:hypothetical protein [Dehalococcoidales bacterium]
FRADDVAVAGNRPDHEFPDYQGILQITGLISFSITELCDFFISVMASYHMQPLALFPQYALNY